VPLLHFHESPAILHLSSFYQSMRFVIRALSKGESGD
jgi:hypothetical protein